MKGSDRPLWLARRRTLHDRGENPFRIIACCNREGSGENGKKKLSQEQTVGVLKRPEVGVPVAELILKIGIAEQTSYRWKAKHAGLGVDQVRHIKQLQQENTKLKQLVTELTPDKTMLPDVLRNKL